MFSAEHYSTPTCVYSSTQAANRITRQSSHFFTLFLFFFAFFTTKLGYAVVVRFCRAKNGTNQSGAGAACERNRP